MKPAAYCDARIREYVKNYLPHGALSVFSEDSSGYGVIRSREMQVAILFADIRGATAISEKIAAAELFRLLNVWFTVMGAVIGKHNGTIIDYVGDEIIVTFGDPDAADTAHTPCGIAQTDSVRCAIEMQHEMERLDALYAELGFPRIEMGIGIHYGKVYVGSIGASSRLKYDVIGRNVNLASRIQAQADGGQILISDEVKNALPSDILIGSSQELMLKGIAGLVTIHALTVGK